MGQSKLMLLEAMFPNIFRTVGVCQTKKAPKGNFLWKNREFSLWNLRSLVSLGLRGAVMSKMMGRTEPMLLEAIFRKRFPTVDVFQPKNGSKGNFLWKNGELSLCHLDSIVS